MYTRRTQLLVTAALAGLAFGAAAHAQSASNSNEVGVEEVVVTAQKRAENVQDVPVSVTAFSKATLEAAGVQDVRDLRRVTANLNLTTSAQTTNTRVIIRGIGTAGNTAIEPSVAFFIDGAYIPRVGSLLAGLNDVASVEVLRGPQGTLFGRNASMGAVLLRTSDPGKDFAAEVTGQVGNYGRNRVTGMINVPLSDTFSARLAILAYETDGYGKNDLTGKRIGFSDAVSVRASTKWEITPNLTWTLKGDYQNLSGDGNPVITVIPKTVTAAAATAWRTRLDPDGAGPLTGVTPYLDRQYSRHVYQESESNVTDFQSGLASDITFEMASGYQIKLISAYRDWHNDQYQVSSGIVPVAFQSRLTTFDSRNHSEELQVLSPETLFGGKLSYVAGAYFYDEDYAINQSSDLYPSFCNVFLRNTSTAARVALCNANPLPGAALIYFDQTTKSYAGYFQGTYKVTDQFALTGGIRYSKDDKTGLFRTLTRNPAAAQANEVTPLDLNQDKVTYRVNATYRPNDDVMVFASFATGFKSGGFDASAGATPIGAKNRTFNPETTKNYELGVKSQLLDRRLIANVTLYRTDISQYQFRSFDGVQFRVQNNGTVRQQGVEFDLIGRPIAPLTLTLSGAYLDSQYTEFKGGPPLPAFTTPQDLTGTRLPYSPKWQGAASAQYVGQLANDWSWLARADLSFTTKQNLSASADNNPDALQSGYALVGARLALRGPAQKWELALIGQNLTAEDVCVGIFNQPNNAAYGLNNTVTGGTVLRCTLNEPRTIAAEAKFRF